MLLTRASPAREIEAGCVNAALGVERAGLHDGAALLEAVAGLVVPELDAAVVAAAHRHAIFVDSQRVDWRVVTRKIL